MSIRVIDNSIGGSIAGTMEFNRIVFVFMSQRGPTATGDNSFASQNNDTTLNSTFHPFMSIHRSRILHKLKLDPSHQLIQDKVQCDNSIQIFSCHAHRGSGGDDTVRGRSDTDFSQKGIPCRICEDINRSGNTWRRRGSRQRNYGRLAGKGHYRGTSV